MSKHNKRFVKILEESRFADPSLMVYFDQETGVQYLVSTFASTGLGLTVLVDQDGKPLLYQSPNETDA